VVHLVVGVCLSYGLTAPSRHVLPSPAVIKDSMCFIFILLMVPRQWHVGLSGFFILCTNYAPCSFESRRVINIVKLSGFNCYVFGPAAAALPGVYF